MAAIDDRATEFRRKVHGDGTMLSGTWLDALLSQFAMNELGAAARMAEEYGSPDLSVDAQQCAKEIAQVIRERMQ